MPATIGLLGTGPPPHQPPFSGHGARAGGSEAAPTSEEKPQGLNAQRGTCRGASGRHTRAGGERESCSLPETSCGCRRSDQDCRGPCDEKRNCHLNRYQPFQPKSGCSNEMSFADQNRTGSWNEEIRERLFLAFQLLAHFHILCCIFISMCLGKANTRLISEICVWKRGCGSHNIFIK